jgi:two-component system, NtrC family, response regulator AtoC
MKGKGRIFLVDDDDVFVSMLSRVLKKSGYDVRTAASAAGIVNKIVSWSPAVVFLDIALPEKSGITILRELSEQSVRTQVVMLTADDTAETAVTAMKLGAFDYVTKPFKFEKIKMVLRNIFEKEDLKKEVTYLRKISSGLLDPVIVGESGAVREVKAGIEKIARASVSTLLITGESGTGKEVFARHAHRLMEHPSRTGFSPFIEINCASLPETLLESELFGHKKGAFTDAKEDKKGLMELAEGGTLLLDEIGEMQLSLQAKLLRVLEQRTVRPVGGIEEIPIDITVISTTNKDLAQLVERGEFRKDLFYRLNTFHVQVPPLRERKEDIPLLAKHFFDVFTHGGTKKSVKRFTAEAEDLLKAYHWPGNIRELRNLVERIVVLEGAAEIGPEHLPENMTGRRSAEQSGTFVLPEEGISLETVEKDLIQQALKRSNNNRVQAAKLLTISYGTLRYQLKKFGLDS